MTEADLLARLRRVTEPCSIAMRRPIDIVDMGLVERIDVDAGHVRVELCLTDPACVHFRALQRYIADVLLEHGGVESVEVVQTVDELWTPDRAAV